MRKTKKSKILSLILCMSLIISTFAFMPQVAAADDSAAPTDATQQAADSADNNDITKMSVKEQYDYIMSLASDEEREAEIDKLSDEQRDKLESYAEKQSQIEELNIISKSSVAPLVKESSSTAKKKAKSKAKATANAAANDSETKEEGLILNKTATANKDGTYTITLESYVTGKVETSTTVTSKPADIVLVLDVSGSMDDEMQIPGSELDEEKGTAEGYYKVHMTWGTYNVRYYNDRWQYYSYEIFSGWQWSDFDDVSRYTFTDGSSKMDALQSAVDNFIEQVHQDSLGKDGQSGTTDDVDHRIAIVKFAGATKSEIGNDFYWSEGYRYNYSQIVKNLTSAKDGATILKTSVSELTPAGATRADFGMKHAQTIINGIDNENPKRDSNKVVVMFTDGQPTSGSQFENKVANSTISASKGIKDNSATVYTVGVFSGADDSRVTNQTSQMNKYMHYVSSNFKNAQSMDNSGDATYPSDANKSYYLAADSAAKLNEIFEAISKETTTGGASITLDKTTEVRDIVSPYFDMPAEASDITVKTAPYEGYDNDGNRKFGEMTGFDATLNVDKDNNTITVTNFDFSSNENCVTDTTKDGKTTYSGNKLIISFTVTPKADFLGGNGVPTNGADSGVYKEDGTSVKKFEQPNVDVPTKEITPEAEDQNIYLTNKADLEKLLKGTDSRINGTNNDYADITYTIKHGDDVVGTLTITKGTDTTADGWTPEWEWNPAGAGTPTLENDKTYTLTCEVNGGTGNVTNTKTPPTATVNVFKPELTYKDSTVYYGDTAPTSYGDNKDGGTVWKHDNTEAKNVTMIGTAPTLDISYSPKPYNKDAVQNSDCYAGGVISTKNDIPVKVTVKIGDKDVTEHVTFVHDTCNEVTDCKFKSADEQFLIHVKTCSLTVTKTGGVKDEPYVMNIYKDDELYTSMTIVGNASETVKELPVGTYTVQEDTNWAWRYKDSTPTISSGVVLSKDKTSGKITVTNHNRYGSFLNGYSTVVKNVFGPSKSN